MKKKTVSKKQEIRTLFNKGKGLSVAKLAKKFKLSESGIRWHLTN